MRLEWRSFRESARSSVQLKLAILTALATRPDGRATLDEIRREVEVLAASDQPEELKGLSGLGDTDIFQSGLVVADGDGFQITDAGRSALRALQSSNGRSFDIAQAHTSHKLIDDLIGPEERSRIFDIELRALGENTDFSPSQEEPSGKTAEIGTLASGPQARADRPPEIDTLHALQETNPSDHANRKDNEAIATGATDAAAPGAPVFLMRSFGSGIQGPPRKLSRGSIVSTLMAAKIQRALGIWRRHLERDVSKAKTGRRTGSIGGGVFALLSLLVIILCAGAVASLTQIRSLKSEIASLQRELFPLKERLAKLDQVEKAKRDLDQQKEAQNKATENSKAFLEGRAERAPLNLSREEVQLIREYIKPAPFTGTAAPATNVGDPITGGTIPLPSSLTDKIPKLVGARFAIRNGAIVIVKRDSRQADAVLPPY
jgi:hypothetical protein